MLKSNKGVTLISLVIYVIVLIIVIALMSNFSGYFYKNTNKITINENNDEQITRFLAYLTKDTNSEELSSIKTGTENSTESNVNYIILRFKNGIEHQYLFKDNNKVYFINKTNEVNKTKKVVLCNNVDLGNFTYDDASKTLTANISVNNKQYEKILRVETHN